MSDMTFHLPELPSFPIPPLPAISDDELRTLALTHSSSHTGSRRAASIDLTPTDKTMDYEKLEHVGDAILGSIVTTLLHDLYPLIGPGTATVLKGCLVANTTLAQLSARYAMPDMIIAAPSALYTTRMQVKVRASVFEAYIAAVFYDFLTSELPGAYEADAASDDDTISITGATADDESIRDDVTECGAPESVSGESIISQAVSAMSITSDGEATPKDPAYAPLDASDDGFHCHVRYPAPESTSASAFASAPRLALLPELRPLPIRTRGGAYDYVERWLRPLFAPIATYAYRTLRDDADAIIKSPSSDNGYIAGATGCLNSWAQKATGELPKYESRAEGAWWRVECRVVTEDGTEHSTSAVRESKKAATSYAAYLMCKELKLDIGEK